MGPEPWEEEPVAPEQWSLPLSPGLPHTWEQGVDRREERESWGQAVCCFERRAVD